MSDILEKLREWHQARVGVYPLLEPAIEEIESLRRQLAVSQDQIDNLMGALGTAMMRYAQALQEKEALMSNVQTPQDVRRAPMESQGARCPEALGGPKINWVP